MPARKPRPEQKPLPERLHQRELDALAAADDRPRPPGWRLSPRAVVDFIIGAAPRTHPDGGRVEIPRKFYGDDALVERSVITLTTLRGLMLVGEPGTAKSMLSGLIAAAVSGDSSLTVQGSAGTTEDQVRYGWNYATLLARGPSLDALVPAPLYLGMTAGKIVRFEELTRCPPEVQDVLLGPLSARLLIVPELEGEARLIPAAPGFNVIATANTRDQGVNELSAALKRRLNIETVRPIDDLQQELTLVKERTDAALAAADVPLRLERDVAALLVTTFAELRAGVTAEGDRVERPSTAMSTAEAVSVAISSGMHAHHFGGDRIAPDHLARFLSGAALKGDADDHKRVIGYFSRVVRRRAAGGGLWQAWYEARRWLT